MARNKIPSYRLHKASGHALVTLSGKDHYLGKHETPESHRKYNRLVAEWLSRGRRPEPDAGKATIDDLADRYLHHAETWYVKRGKTTPTFRRNARVIADLRKLYGDCPIGEFTPRSFMAVRESWVVEGLARSTINQYGEIVRGIFRWGVKNSLVPPEVIVGLESVGPLVKGRSRARETLPIRPPDLATVERTMAELPKLAREICRLMLASGMRPTEARVIRPIDIDRSGPVWLYRVPPEWNKTEHHDMERIVALGPQAQKILQPLLDRPNRLPTWPIFATRTKPSKILCENYTRGTIARVCEAHGIPVWSPNQLRHAVATTIRKRYGLEAAQVVLGHANADITQIYAEADLDKAIEVAMAIG